MLFPGALLIEKTNGIEQAMVVLLASDWDIIVKMTAYLDELFGMRRSIPPHPRHGPTWECRRNEFMAS